MNRPTPRHDPELPMDVLDLVNRICDRFEAAWESGDRPRIEDHLEEVAAAYRPALLRDLLAAELAARRRRGERPEPREYGDRFRDDPEAITAAFADAPDPITGEPPAATLDGSAGPATSDAFRADQERTRSYITNRRRLGKFELLERVGSGAFGAVWRARDTELGRLVAVKIPHAGHLASEPEAQRFSREARSTARLRHPGVVTVHEVGRHENLPYIVADFIEGVTLADLLSARRLDFREAAALLAEVAEATDYAHSMGVVHRDIKPSNIILDRTSIRPGDGQGAPSPPGRPMLMDFGLARHDGAEATMTQEGDVLGTPAYMSPEQAAGHSHTADARCDVYSLGVVLYLLLTGELPFHGTIRMMIDQVLREEPRPPRRLNDRVPRDLETICLKAMAKEPGHRYTTARELAEDLRRFLAGETIRARPVPFWERGWRWSRRHPAQGFLAIASGVAALALVGLTVGASFNAELTRLNRQLEGTNRALQQTNSALAVSRQDEEAQRRRAEQNLFYRNILLAGRELQENHIGRVEELLDQTPAAFRGWEWNYLMRQCRVPLATFTAPAPEVYGLALSRDGKLLAASTGSGRVRVWNLATRLVRHEFEFPGAGMALAFHPDGTQLAAGQAAPGTDSQVVRLWSLQTGRGLRDLRGHTGEIFDVTFSPDGTRLASASSDGTVRVWDSHTGQSRHVLRGPCSSYAGVTFSPDGNRLFTSSGTLNADSIPPPPYETTVWDARTGNRLKAFPHGTVLCGGLSQAGTRLAVGDWHGQVWLWDLEHDPDGHNPRILRGHTAMANRVSFSPDATRLASASDDGSIKIWDAVSGKELFTLRGHRAAVQNVAFHPDGNQVVSVSSDGTALLWNARIDPRSRLLPGHTGPVRGLAYSPDGSRLASVSEDRTFRSWDASTGKAMGKTVVLGEKGQSVAYSPDGRQVAIACGDWSRPDTAGIVEIRDSDSGQLRHRLQGHQRIAWAVAYNPRGAWLASAGGETHLPGEILLWDPKTGLELGRLPGVPEGLYCLAMNPDGNLLATGSMSGTIRLWDVELGELAWTRQVHKGFVRSICFSPSGTTLLSSGQGNVRVILSNPRDGDELRSLPGPTHQVDSAIYSPDGRRLATSSMDGRIQLWDGETGEEVLSLRVAGHESAHCLAFSPDGTELASAGTDGVIRLWDARPLPDPASR